MISAAPSRLSIANLRDSRRKWNAIHSAAIEATMAMAMDAAKIQGISLLSG